MQGPFAHLCEAILAALRKPSILCARKSDISAWKVHPTYIHNLFGSLKMWCEALRRHIATDRYSSTVYTLT